MLAVVLWLTVAGTNVPSEWLFWLLIETVHPWLKSGAAWLHLPWWLDGLLIDGMYRATAWVVAVMLPPMAIFFPLFTLLEDFGYLPRVAFNMDRVFRSCGAHGKQALTMCMGFGCNAAGVVATRVIDSPRERLLAIITNNFSLCNGRWPTQILIATIFVGALFPSYLSGLVSTAAVVGVALVGRRRHFCGFLGAVEDAVAGRGLLVSSGTAALSAAASAADAVHFADRPHDLRALAGGGLRGTGRSRDLADRPHPCGRSLVGSVAGRAVRSRRTMDRAERRDPAGLRGRDPGQRDRDPHGLDADRRDDGNGGIGSGEGVMFEAESVGQTTEILREGGWTLLTG
jgi:hypothetical protein